MRACQEYHTLYNLALPATGFTYQVRKCYILGYGFNLNWSTNRCLNP